MVVELVNPGLRELVLVDQAYPRRVGETSEQGVTEHGESDVGPRVVAGGVEADRVVRWRGQDDEAERGRMNERTTQRDVAMRKNRTGYSRRRGLVARVKARPDGVHRSCDERRRLCGFPEMAVVVTDDVDSWIAVQPVVSGRDDECVVVKKASATCSRLQPRVELNQARRESHVSATRLPPPSKAAGGQERMMIVTSTLPTVMGGGT